MRELATPAQPAGRIGTNWNCPLVFGGIQTVMRPLRGGDEPALQAFFHSHTPETIHARYGCLVTDLSPQRATALVRVDESRDCALGIFELCAGGEELRAVGRYCLDLDGQAAELAFVVRESMRRLGLATTLLQSLKATARERGLQRLWAQVEVTNAAMLQLFHHHGFTFSPQPGLKIVTLHLGPAGAPLQRRPPRPRASRLF
jgi:GNAT superfamily N-acetyltransferase